MGSVLAAKMAKGLEQRVEAEQTQIRQKRFVINKLHNVFKAKIDQQGIGEDDDENHLTESQLMEDKPFQMNLLDDEDECEYTLL